MTSFYISASPFRDQGLEFIIGMGAVSAIVTVVSVLVSLNRLIREVRTPRNFADKLIKFIADGRNKGFELNDDGELMTFLNSYQS